MQPSERQGSVGITWRNTPPTPAQRAAATPAPWTEAVDGAQLLDDLAALYRRYVVLPDGAAAAIVLANWPSHGSGKAAPLQ